MHVTISAWSQLITVTLIIFFSNLIVIAPDRTLREFSAVGLGLEVRLHDGGARLSWGLGLAGARFW